MYEANPMCLFFIYLGNWSKTPTKKLYKLIIANNRDEFYSRRAVPCTFWDSPSHILAGRELDCPQGRGTYLGVSKTGRLGNLLKIKREVHQHKHKHSDEHECQPLPHRPTKKETFFSRSSIVPDFLTSGKSSDDYCTQLCGSCPFNPKLKKYYPFHLLAIDILGGFGSGLKATYLTNLSSPDVNAKHAPVDITPPPGTCDFFGYGNSPNYKPFQKVVHGRQEFIDIISQHMSDDSGAVISSEQRKKNLHDELLEFLRSRRRYLPDPVILEYARVGRIKEKVAYKLSSRFVTDYFDSGTRSQSIILVDTDNNVSFYEWHLKHPIYDPAKAEWIESEHEFKL